MGSKEESKYLVATGFPRTATLGMVKFNELFGIESYHQRGVPPSYLRFVFYRIHKVPGPVDDYVKWKALYSGFLERKRHLFEASWDFGNFIHLFQKAHPGLDVLINLRDPAGACNSLFVYDGKGYKNIQECAALYIYHYTRILEQARCMDRKPVWIEFENYIQGHYNSAFFNYFSIPDTDENNEKAYNFLKVRVNHRKDYKIKDSPLFFAAGREIVEQIKEELQEFR